MTARKIIFTIKSINKEDTNTTNMRILPLEVEDNGGNKVENIARIHFVMHDGNQKSKLDILKEQETYELSFDDGEMRVNKSEDGNVLSAGSFASAIKESKSASAGHTWNTAEPIKKGPFVLVNEDQKEI